MEYRNISLKADRPVRGIKTLMETITPYKYKRTWRYEAVLCEANGDETRLNDAVPFTATSWLDLRLIGAARVLVVCADGGPRLTIVLEDSVRVRQVPDLYFEHASRPPGPCRPYEVSLVRNWDRTILEPDLSIGSLKLDKDWHLSIRATVAQAVISVSFETANTSALKTTATAETTIGEIKRWYLLHTTSEIPAESSRTKYRLYLIDERSAPKYLPDADTLLAHGITSAACLLLSATLGQAGLPSPDRTARPGGDQAPGTWTEKKIECPNEEVARALHQKALIQKHCAFPSIQAVDQISIAPSRNGWVFRMLVQNAHLQSLTEIGHISASAAHIVLLGIAYALRHMHSKGIVHFNVGPGRIRLLSEHEPILTGFGYAFHMRHGPSTIPPQRDRRELIPEIAEGSKFGPPADIWDFGLLVELYNSAGQYDSLITQCLSRNPADRPSAAAIADDLTGGEYGEIVSQADVARYLTRLPPPRFP
jgi:hypothetical protein